MLDPWTLVVWAALLLVLPLPWLLAAALAAVVHELCHIGAVRILDGQVYGLHIGPAGAVMEGSLPNRRREILAAAAGPAGSLALMLLARVVPRLAVCGLIQGLFNLLPIYPLDGGRILRLSLDGRLSRRSLEILEGLLGAAVCLALFRWRRILGLILTFHLIFRKIPCKRSQIGVQ